jgi:hypothetical protein
VVGYWLSGVGEILVWDMALSCLSVPGLIASCVLLTSFVVVVQLADRGVRPVSRARTRGRTGDRCAVVAYR